MTLLVFPPAGCAAHVVHVARIRGAGGAGHVAGCSESACGRYRVDRRRLVRSTQIEREWKNQSVSQTL